MQIQLQQNITKKIETITKDQKPFIVKILTEMAKINSENVEIIYNYIVAEQNEINIASDTKGDKIKRLELLSRHYLHSISFKNMTKENIQHYLNTLKKSEEEDPTHKWIGTYNSRYNIFLKFFKWVYQPSKQAKERKTPKCIKGIKPLTRNEISCYTADDMWKDHEAAMFLKYCNDSRDKCYMAMAFESSGRPHELLKLKFKDLRIEVDSDNQKFARVILRSNKKGVKPRTVSFTFAIPYIKEWRNKHPFGSNDDAYIFVSLAKKNKMEKITRDGLYKRFNEYYKQKYFPRLLDDNTIPEEDKKIIKEMFENPWNLYVQRHSSLTYIAKHHNIGDPNFREHAGWTPNSPRPEVYLHYFGNETADILLEKKGIKINGNKTDPLKSIQCPNCSEVNKPTNTFCDNCKLALKMEAFYKSSEKELEINNQLDNMEKRIARWEFESWIEKYEEKVILENEEKAKMKWNELRKSEPNNVYGIQRNKEIVLSTDEQLTNFKSFYLEREGKDLTEERIKILPLKPRNIKVHQVEFITTSDNILTDKELKGTIGIDMDDMINKFL